MKRVPIIFFVILLVPSLLGFFVATQIRHALADKRPPITAFYGVESLNSPIRSGEYLDVRVERHKIREDCPLTSLRSATDLDGKTYDVPDAINTLGGSSTEGFVDISYFIPEDVPTGVYELRVTLIYVCPNVDIPFVYTQPPAKFRVTSKGLE